MQFDLPPDQLLTMIAEMDRTVCIEQLRHLPHIRTDFSDSFLDNQSDDQLRHILLAAAIREHRHMLGQSGPHRRAG